MPCSLLAYLHFFQDDLDNADITYVFCFVPTPLEFHDMSKGLIILAWNHKLWLHHYLRKTRANSTASETDMHNT